MPSVVRRILLLSDSHGYSLDSLLMKASSICSFDAVFHAGDGFRDLGRYEPELPMIYQVGGNCDFFHAPQELTFDLFGKRFLLCHGHRYSVKTTMSLLEDRAREVKADCVVFGHTHNVYNKTRNGILYLNPGAACDRYFMILQIMDDNSLYARIYS